MVRALTEPLTDHDGRPEKGKEGMRVCCWPDNTTVLTATELFSDILEMMGNMRAHRATGAGGGEERSGSSLLRLVYLLPTLYL